MLAACALVVILSLEVECARFPCTHVVIFAVGVRSASFPCTFYSLQVMIFSSPPLPLPLHSLSFKIPVNNSSMQFKSIANIIINENSHPQTFTHAFPKYTQLFIFSFVLHIEAWGHSPPCCCWGNYQHLMYGGRRWFWFLNSHTRTAQISTKTVCKYHTNELEQSKTQLSPYPTTNFPANSWPVSHLELLLIYYNYRLRFF